MIKMIKLLGDLSGIIGGFLAYGFMVVVVIVLIKSASDKGRSNKVEPNKDIETDFLIDDLKRKQSINCQVCGKEILYNDNGTCDECHQEIMRRLETKSNK